MTLKPSGVSGCYGSGLSSLRFGDIITRNDALDEAIILRRSRLRAAKDRSAGRIKAGGGKSFSTTSERCAGDRFARQRASGRGRFRTGSADLPQGSGTAPHAAELHYNLGISLFKRSDPRARGNVLSARALEFGLNDPRGHLSISMRFKSLWKIRRSLLLISAPCHGARIRSRPAAWLAPC